jgi:hypothetical protein
MSTAEQCKTANGRFEMPKSNDKAEPAKQAQG